jgi:multidrug efflux pump subunit AcrB
MIGPNLSAWAVGRRSLIFYFMIVALAAGVISFLGIGRAEDPVFTIKTMLVRAVWPGATLDDTLQQITERIERKLQETPGLKTLRSFTSAGVTTIFIDIEGKVSSSEIPDVWYEVRKKVGDIRHTLPSGVVGPFFDDEFGDTYGFIYGFTADGFTHRELRDYVEAVRSRLLTAPDVSKIEMIGAQDEAVFIEFSPDRVAAMGLDYPALFAAISAQNIVRPAGVIRTGDENVSLRVSGAFESELDLLEVNIPVGGRVVRLGDIARVVRGYSDPAQPMFRVNGSPAIGIGVAMREGGDILALGANIKKMMAAITADLPIGIEPELIADQAVTVDGAIGEFTTSLWQAVAIILAISIVSLGLRPGAVVAIAIPLTLAAVMVVMDLVNIDLQRISLGALIIALGLLVDDAMTTVDAMLRRLAAGDDPGRAASFAYANLAAPMLIGTLVTIAGFVPIGFAASSAGEYTFSIFAVVAIALILSWFVAVLFAPVIGALVLKAPASGQADPPPGFTMRAYRGLLSAAIRFRWITIITTIALFVAAMWGMRFVPQQFFPASDRTELLVDMSLQQNASIRATEDAAKRIDAVLADDPDVERWSAYVGRGAIRFYLPLNVQLPNDFFAQHVIVAKDVPARDRLQEKLTELLANEFPGVVSRVSPLELGPPVGWPIQYRIVGADLDKLRDLATGLAGVVAAHPQTTRVNFDWIEPARQLRIMVDQNEARRLGLSSQSLAATLNTAVTGTTITQVRDDIYLVNVIARARQEDRIALDNLRTLQVPLPGGRTVALSQFATFEATQEQPIVWRRDRIPTLTVQADVTPGALADDVVTDLAPAIASFDAGLPPGYRVELGGIAEESAESRASVMAVGPLMLFLMLTFLMLQLQSFQRLAMVALVMPLGMIGVVGALLLVQKPLGFVAILGVLALLGMIAKNAVILITQIEDERVRGVGVQEAVVAAAMSRFRPLMLTALSTVLGLVPIAPTVFWGPMAFAIMGGLLVATLLTLVFLPVVYVTWFDRRTAAEGHRSQA